ncbi:MULTISPECIES: hemerythrin domain-containing protein [unclassified Nocardia]|uniref:hemerythrin domain-containing protein n=1 Tax=Nocardia sp. NPDC019255 TaxID=3154591 RepID=UPI0033E7BDDF
MFAETADTSDPVERESKFFELRRLLAVHETAEEEIIHPRARRELGTARPSRMRGWKRRTRRKSSSPRWSRWTSARWNSRSAELREAVLAHADHEEREEFNRLRAELDDETLRRLRRTVELAETMAPTRPHPGVESATANVLVGPFAAMMDRAKDMISKPRH